MSGPSVKVPVDWLDSDDVEDLGSDAAMLMITALGYAARQTSDGIVPRKRLRKLWPVDDLDECVRRLAAVGELKDRGDDVYFTRWRDFILALDEVEQIRASSRERTERSRRHRKGDHTMCRADYCSAARRDKSRNGDVTVRVSDGHPTRPVPTRPDPTAREGGEGSDQAGSASATPTRRLKRNNPAPHRFDGTEDHCQDCGHLPSAVTHRAHDFIADELSGEPDPPCKSCGLEFEDDAHTYWFHHVA